MDFGTSNRERDLYRRIDQLTKLVNSLNDQMKHMYQKSRAQIISKQGKKYIVELLREKKFIEADLDDNMNEWGLKGFPLDGEFVWVEHKLDLFGAIITGRVRPADYDDSIVKKNTIMSAKGKQ